MKKCSNCGETKLVSKFSKHKSSREGIRSQCKECLNIKKREYLGVVRKQDPLRLKRQTLMGQYNITLEEYIEILYTNQNGVCPLCEVKAPSIEEMIEDRFWSVDHYHSCCPNKSSCGKCVRGILCDPCNNAMKQPMDNKKWWENAGIYLGHTEVSDG